MPDERYDSPRWIMNNVWGHRSGIGEADVDYTYESVTISGSAKNIRLDKITYPNGGEVYYDYATSELGSGLSRPDNIASSGSPGESDKHAAYTYVGSSMVVKVAHPGRNEPRKADLRHGRDVRRCKPLDRQSAMPWMEHPKTTASLFNLLRADSRGADPRGGRTSGDSC